MAASVSERRCRGVPAGHSAVSGGIGEGVKPCLMKRPLGFRTSDFSCPSDWHQGSWEGFRFQWGLEQRAGC